MDSCDPSSGICKHIPKDCKDGDKCTLDSCDPYSGQCKHVPKDCKDGDKCTVDSCDPYSGQCKHVPKDCKDGDKCTVDSCNPYTGRCVHKRDPYCRTTPSSSPSSSEESCKEIHLSVKHWERFDISSNPDGSFLFGFEVSMPQNDSSLLLDFTPYSDCQLNQCGSCSNRAPDTASPSESSAYCKLFKLQYPSAYPWHMKQLPSKHVYYSANFTLESLSACRRWGEPGQELMKKHVEYQNISLSGSLYASGMKRYEECPQPAPHCERMLHSSSYHFELGMDSYGSATARYRVGTGLHGIRARWLRNIWMADGTLLSYMETCLERHEGQSTQLMNAEVDHSHESGKPMSFMYENASCEPLHLKKYRECCQTWQLRAGAGAGDGDFSGLKSLRWEGLVPYSRKKHPFKIDVDLEVSRSPLKEWRGNRLHCELHLYRDRRLHELYLSEDNHTMEDCDMLYGLLSVRSIGPHFKLDIWKVTVCVPNTGSALPFDADAADVTGCNTPGVGMQRIVIYNSQQGFVDESYDYQPLQDPPSDPYDAAFSMKARAHDNDYKHVVEVLWSLHDTHSGTTKRDGQAEFFTEDAAYGFAGISHVQGYGHGDFFVKCPHGKSFFDKHSKICRDKRHDDDDDDDHNHFFVGGGLLLFLLLIFLLLLCLSNCSCWNCCQDPLCVPPPVAACAPPLYPPSVILSPGCSTTTLAAGPHLESSNIYVQGLHHRPVAPEAGHGQMGLAEGVLVTSTLRVIPVEAKME